MAEEGPIMHPGELLLEGFMKPKGVTQYRLAQELGVPQIRISEIVRGKRAISADTALRLARFFQDTTADFWMSRQWRCDLAAEKGRLGENLERVRPQTPVRGTLRAGRAFSLGTLVNASDLTSWAERRESQGQLPRVVRDLVLATAEYAERVVFSADEGVQLPGWDGIVDAPQGNAFVPNGLSAWEVGTDKDVKRKANRDYAKRTKDPLGLDPSETTFVFVTPRFWIKKREWAAEKQEEGVWREVRVYDAEDLTTWLEFAPGVHIRLSTLTGKHPEGASALRDFWEGWAGVAVVPMSAELIISGRQKEAEHVIEWLRGPISSVGLRAESKEEALAFFAASLYRTPAVEQEAYYARSIVVEDRAAWRQLAGYGEGLVLIPRFDVQDTDVILAGHHVLVPLGRSEGCRSVGIKELSRPRRDEAREALLGMGLSTERAENLATLIRRSPMALRRRLSAVPQVKRPGWADPPAARCLLPAMLAGAWEGTNDADREVVAKLARGPYSEVEEDLIRWATQPDPPVRQVGSTWFVSSKEDSWLLLAESLTPEDLDVFEEAVLGVLGEIRPSLDMPDEQRWAAGAYGKSLPHSGPLRKGVAETLALIGASSETPQFSTANATTERASAIVRRLLERANDDWRMWASISDELPLLAEAAPGVFLKAVDQSTTGDRVVLVDLFRDPGPFGSSPHTGLLWALETLAWAPEHLGYASQLLARLAALDPDPGSRYVSRPLRSLQEVFLLWFPQTKADPIRRLRVIDAVRRREPEIAWQLMCNILPEVTGGFSTPNFSPRWRDWAPEEPPKVTYGEIWAAIAAIVERLLEDVGTDGGRWRDLIERIDDLPNEQHDAVVDRLMSIDIVSFDRDAKTQVRNSLREVVSKHREFPDAHWVMSSKHVHRLQDAYERFEPEDPVSRHAWLFSDHPGLLEPSGEDWRVEREKLESARVEAAREVYEKGGLDRLLELAARADRPGELGTILGTKEILTVDDEDRLLHRTLGSPDNLHDNLAPRYIFSRTFSSGWQWVDGKLSGDASIAWFPQQRAQFFLGLPFGSRCWDRLEATEDEEAIRLYWSNVSPYGLENSEDCGRAVDELAHHGRPHAAIDLIHLYLMNGDKACVTNEKIVELLEGAVSKQPGKAVSRATFGRHVADLLDHLEGSAEVEESRIANLEWAYLTLFGHGGRPARILHRELSRDPSFFAEIITLVFKAEDEERREPSQKDRNRARLAYKLLDTWHSVPGRDENGSINAGALRTWVDQARQATRTASRGTVGDLKLGEVLAHAPDGADGTWPDVAVRDLIDDLSAEDLERGMEIGIFNKRGVYSKSLDEGGKQERQLADKYRSYADSLADEWPRTAAMLRRISDRYVSDARREDVKAELREDLWL